MLIIYVVLTVPRTGHPFLLCSRHLSGSLCSAFYAVLCLCLLESLFSVVTGVLQSGPGLLSVFTCFDFYGSVLPSLHTWYAAAPHFTCSPGFVLPFALLPVVLSLYRGDRCVRRKDSPCARVRGRSPHQPQRHPPNFL